MHRKASVQRDWCILRRNPTTTKERSRTEAAHNPNGEKSSVHWEQKTGMRENKARCGSMPYEWERGTSPMGSLLGFRRGGRRDVAEQQHLLVARSHFDLVSERSSRVPALIWEKRCFYEITLIFRGKASNNNMLDHWSFTCFVY